MARTKRMSRDYRPRAERDGSGYCCPEGRGCQWCGEDSRRSNLIRAIVAREKVAEVWA